MADFLTTQNRAKRLTPSIVSQDIFNFIRGIERELAAFNRATLFQDSEDVDGKPIGFYSRATELITNGRKAKGQPFDLKETGDFLEGIFAKVEKESIFFDTTDPKKTEVFKNLLSDNIFGLQDDDLKRAIDTRILPFVIKYYNQKLF